jgi:hypothetical protein
VTRADHPYPPPKYEAGFIMRWIRTLICALAPLALAACAGGPDFEAMTDHPGHPDASAAPTVALPGTLAISPLGAAAPMEMATETAAEAVLYTCPMHPEIVRSEPGTCPICGMALVPKAAAPKAAEPKAAEPKATAPEAGAEMEEDPHAHH